MTRHAASTRAAIPARTAVLIDLENILHLEEDPLPGTVPCCTDDVAHSAGLSIDPHRGWDHQRATYTWVCEPTAARAVEEVRALAGPADFTITAACTALLCRTAFLAPMAGVALRAVPATPDAADAFLLDQAEHLAAAGFTRFVIASGDRCFAEFAARHETVVICRSTRSVSHELWLSATAVRVLSPRAAAAVSVPA